MTANGNAERAPHNRWEIDVVAQYGKHIDVEYEEQKCLVLYWNTLCRLIEGRSSDDPHTSHLAGYSTMHGTARWNVTSGRLRLGGLRMTAASAC